MMTIGEKLLQLVRDKEVVMKNEHVPEGLEQELPNLGALTSSRINELIPFEKN